MSSGAMRVVEWYSGPARYRRFGYTCIGLGVVFALVLVARVGVSDSPSLGWSLVLALMSAAFQVGAAIAFRNDGQERRAHDQLVRSTTKRLLRLGVRSQEATEMAEQAFESGLSAQNLQLVLGRLSERLSSITDQVGHALEDWQFHPAAARLDPDPAEGRIRRDPSEPIPRGAEDDDDEV